MAQNYHCAAPNCDYYGETKGTSRFPSHNPDLCLKWAQALHLKTYGKAARVCHSHFDEKEDFIYGANDYKRLKSTAVPSKNLPVVSQKFHFIQTF